jgi:hypothetical protein
MCAMCGNQTYDGGYKWAETRGRAQKSALPGNAPQQGGSTLKMAVRLVALTASSVVAAYLAVYLRLIESWIRVGEGDSGLAWPWSFPSCSYR